MDLPLALRTVGGSYRHVRISCQPGVAVSEVADELAAWAGFARGRTYELCSLDRNTVLDPGREFATSGFLSGELVTLVEHPARKLQVPTVAVTVSGGEDQGKEFLLAPGLFLVGRSRACQLRLTDGSVSREHVELRVAPDGSYSLSPRTSTNAIFVDESELQSVSTYAGSHDVRLGNCSLAVFPHGRGRVPANSGGRIPYAPSPRLTPPASAKEFSLPNPPAPNPPQRLPMISSLAPLVLAVVTFFISRNPSSFLLALLSPVVALLSYWESRLHQTKEHALMQQEWHSQVGKLKEQLQRSIVNEKKRLERLYPSTNEIIRWLQNTDPRIWERQPNQADCLNVRAGLGAVGAPWTIKLPSQGPADVIASAARNMAGCTTIEGAPVCIDLGSHPCISVRLSSTWADSTKQTQGFPAAVASSLMIQATGLLSPHDLVVAACVHHSVLAEWDWLKWLPHVQSTTGVDYPGLAVREESVAALTKSLAAILEQRRLHRRQHSNSSQWPYVLVLIDPGTGTPSQPLLHMCRDNLGGLGVGVIVVERQSKRVTPGATAVLTLTSPNRARLSYPAAGVEQSLNVEATAVGLRVMTGRLLCPLMDTRLASSTAEALPSSVRLVDLSGFPARDDPQAVIRAWKSHGQSLAAVVGQSAQSKVEVDLRVDGPHGLVAGTTGAGKSEFLQSLIASFAIRHSPKRLTFLLVDYKGGAAFKDCRDLVHTVGLVTDLDGHLVSRVLASLRAELRYREHLLARYNCRDIMQMEKEKANDAPPNLLIVVDEFAALAREMPDFVTGMVDVAQRGRSLGIHMLLATQRPAGVVTDNIRANTNLRIALRVSDVAESMDVLGSPVAAYFERQIPGRAALRVGPSELVTFQAAYVGGWTQPGLQRRPITVSPFRVDDNVAAFTRFEPPPESPTERPTQLIDLVKYVQTINTAAVELDMPAPRRPWLPELPSVIDLASGLQLPALSGCLGIGLLDDPDRQEQRTLLLNFNKCGNLLVIGTSGAGKTFFLRTVAGVIGVQGAEPVHLYGIDCSGYALKLIEELPFVGSIVPAGDFERTTRLLQMLRTTIDARNHLLAAHAANDLDELRRRSSELAQLPRLLVLIDGLHALLETYERLEGGTWLDYLIQLLAEGRSVGVHFIIAADRRSGIPMRFASLLPSVLTLRLATADEYLAAGVPPDSFGSSPTPGRAFYEGLEVQLASLDGAISGEQQAIAFRRLAARLQEAGKDGKAPSIRSLPTELSLADLTPGFIGMASEGLVPVRMPGWRVAGIFGPAKSGRTTALLTFGAACASSAPERKAVLIGDHTILKSSPRWLAHVATGAEEGRKALEELMTIMHDNTELNPIVLIDDLNDMLDPLFEDALNRFLQQPKTTHFSLIVTGESSSIRQSYNTVVQSVRKAKAGVLLVPDILNDGDIFNLSLPRTTVNWTKGRGYMVSGSDLHLLQIAI